MMCAGSAAQAAEINAFISTAIKSATDEILPPFERVERLHHSCALFAARRAAQAFRGRRACGYFCHRQRGDRQLIGEGKIVPGRIDLAKTGIGICVQQGRAASGCLDAGSVQARAARGRERRLCRAGGRQCHRPAYRGDVPQARHRRTDGGKNRFAAGGPNGRVSVMVSSGEARDRLAAGLRAAYRIPMSM